MRIKNNYLDGVYISKSISIYNLRITIYPDNILVASKGESNKYFNTLNKLNEYLNAFNYPTINYA